MSRITAKPAVLIGGLATVAALAFLTWVWWGSVAALGRGIAASLPLKLLIAGAVMLAVAIVLTERRRRAIDRQYWNRRDEGTPVKIPAKSPVVWCYTATAMLLVGSLVALPFTGYWRAVTTAESTGVTVDAQKDYQWRTPWVTASLAASSKAGNVVGDFLPEETTYLPAIDAYVTPVAARGFAAGMGAVAIQHRDGRSETCQFTGLVPRISGGWFSANLTRAIAFVDPALSADSADAWVYCDEGQGRLVVPVIRYVGILEGVPTPAGVVIFDGTSAELKTDVAAGELPGPVYPSSIAAAQRDSLTAANGVWGKIFNRAGYETSEDVDGDPNSGNVAELLLERADNSGWDYVTPLSPRGKSFTIAGVAVVNADTVTAGKFNPLTVHTLEQSREGNLAVADRVKAAFPQLGWASGLALVEVIPTSLNTWSATLTNGRVVANRVALDQDGSLCLQTPTGEQIRCVTADGAAQQPTDTTGAGGGTATPDGGTLGQLSDQQLAELAVEVAAEQLRRAEQAAGQVP